jgi:hypothetical protein
MPHFECGALNHSATSPWPMERKIKTISRHDPDLAPGRIAF